MLAAWGAISVDLVEDIDSLLDQAFGVEAPLTVLSRRHGH
jgi:hypothetical protein